MANIMVPDILARVRSLMTEPDADGRWSDSEILLHANDSCYQIALRVDWPEASITTQTQNDPGGNPYQEYTLPPMIAILRVYVAGQLVPETDINTLDGIPDLIWDQWGSQLTPQWQQISGGFVYPVQNDKAVPVDNVQYYNHMRPKCYLRGGNLGFVYPPTTGQTIQIDCIPEPVVLDPVINTESAYPRVFMDAIVFNTLSRMYLADENDQKATLYDQRYENALKTCVTWKRNLLRNKPRTIHLYPYRLVTYSSPGYRG